jgi:hypothetical protein
MAFGAVANAAVIGMMQSGRKPTPVVAWFPVEAGH